MGVLALDSGGRGMWTGVRVELGRTEILSTLELCDTLPLILLLLLATGG